MPKLICNWGTEAEAEFPLEEGETTVGRQRGNAVTLPDPRVSRSHFSIILGNGSAMLLNRSQTHGTYVNGIRVDENIQLDDGDQIKVGDSTLVFFLAEPDPTSQRSISRGGHMAGDDEESVQEISMLDQDQGGFEDFFAVADPKSSQVSPLTEGGIDAARLERLYEQMVLIQEIGQQLVAELDLKELFALILTKVFDLLRVDTGSILLFDPENKRVVPVAVRNREGEASTRELKVSRSMVQYAVRNRVGVLSADTQADERFQEQVSIIARGIRSALCVPMIYMDEILGVVYIDNVYTDYAFTKDDLNLLSIVANQAAIALRNAKLMKQIVSEETQRANLSRYLTPQLVDRIATGGFEMSLGGKKVAAAILFSDIRGFTSFSEGLPPEDVVAMLNAYFSEMTEIVFHYQGTLDKYVGDAIIAAFGSPVPDEHASVNALRCAAVMQERLKSFEFEGRPVNVGIGVHYGEVIHGNVGSERIMQYTVIGDTVNTASRLCSVAKAGQVILSKAVIENIGRPIEVNELEPAKLKGKSELFQVFEYTGGPDKLS